MYTVTEVKQLRNKKYQLMIKSEDLLETIEITEDIMVEFRLLKGKELSKKDYKLFKQANAKDVIYQKVLHYALYKMRAVKDIYDYLHKNKIPFSEQNYYINKLKRAKIIDDVLYAEVYVRENFYDKKYGPMKIAKALELKNIDASIYRSYIDQITKQEIEENLQLLFDKKLKGMKNKSIKATSNTLKQYLISKGYDFSTVNQFIQKNQEIIKHLTDETDALKKDLEKALKQYENKENKHTKVITYLMRKGYEYQTIKAIVGEMNNEENDGY